jgi:hypothetical protein
METMNADLASLRERHALLLKEKAAAVSALSDKLFNQPHLHDSFRSTGAYLRLKSCNEDLHRLEEAMRLKRA